MKKIIYFFLFLLPISALAQDDENISWSSSRRLTWNDYVGSPSEPDDAAAVTNTSIGMEYHFKNNLLSFKISCSFSKTRSWTRNRTNYILSHEQGHFDITEIFARKLAKALKEYEFSSRKYVDEIGKIYKSVMDEKEKFQNAYDEETDFSRNRTKQFEWLNKINEQLDQLDDYKEYSLVIAEKRKSPVIVKNENKQKRNGRYSK